MVAGGRAVLDTGRGSFDMLGVSAAAAAMMQPSLRIMLLAFGALSLRSDGMLDQFSVIDALLRRSPRSLPLLCYPQSRHQHQAAAHSLVINQLP